jgi:hypothetical protein
VRALDGPLTLQNGPLPPIPGTLIHAEDSSFPVLRCYGERMAELRGAQLALIPGGPDVVHDSPDQLLAALLWVADQ